MPCNSSPDPGPTFPNSNSSEYTAKAKLILNSSGGITGVLILYSGLGYSSTSPPSVTVVPTGSSQGDGGQLSAQVYVSRYIRGQINNDNVRYDGYFK